MKTKFIIENRFDLFSGESLEQNTQDANDFKLFKDKRNMKSYFLMAQKTEKPKVAHDFIFNIYNKYKEIKKIQFAPQYVESMSFKYLPNILTVDSFYIGGYKQLIEDLKYDSYLKYDNNSIACAHLPKDLIVIQDTREKSALKLQVNTKIATLPFGDYSLDREEQTLYIERKSIADGWGTLSSNNNFERFCREIERAREKDKYILILIESTFSKFYAHGFSNRFFSKKANRDLIGHRMRTLCRKFPKHVQFLFVDGRKEAAKILPQLLFLDKKIINLDLQYLHNKGKFSWLG